MYRYIFFLFFLTACSNPKEDTTSQGREENDQLEVQKKEGPNFPSGTFTPKTFQGEQGWGYDIYMGDKRYIHQPHKPAVGGNQGFENAGQANAIAEFVIHKLNQGIMPPSVSAIEVDSILKLVK